MTVIRAEAARRGSSLGPKRRGHRGFETWPTPGWMSRFSPQVRDGRPARC